MHFENNDEFFAVIPAFAARISHHTTHPSPKCHPDMAPVALSRENQRISRKVLAEMESTF
ncbi:hypothetical protein CQ018_14275 [Arthrobacter sp. MYb227]|nr:hypothetical protein CQ018_14275 [Arthrobacter sp. MYb227]